MKKILVFFVLVSVFSAKAQNVYIPNPIFRNVLINTPCSDTNGDGIGDADVDTNNDFNIQLSEALAVTLLTISNQNISGALTGINSFTNMSTFICDGNQLTAITLTLPNLTGLYCSENLLTSLEVSGCPNLQSLYCNMNSLSMLDLSNNSHLNYINCSDNQLTSLILNTQNAGSYPTLWVNNNLLSTIELGNYDYYSVVLSGNPLQSVIFPENIDINYLYITETTLPSIDLSHVTWQQLLTIANNPNLESINIKNGRVDYSSPLDFDMEIHDNPSLQYICGDDITYLYCDALDGCWWVNELNYLEAYNPGVTTTSYCSFTPGGAYDNVEGNIKFDCDGSNTNLQNVKLEVTQNNQNGQTFTDVFGNYHFFATNGQMIVTPQLNPGYFTVEPPNFVYNFTNYGATETANFCVSVNGFHPDLEISISEVSPARPGFDADYKIIYRNIGTEVQSGTVVFNYNDLILDYISSVPGFNSSSVGALNWSFSNLLPLETREILIKLNVNSPMETPAVNIGEIITWEANVISSAADETPANNAFTFDQVVTGSFDPNDKAVQEHQISPQSDDYLNYIIRFQNTGTYLAENVVVKDTLSAKLDWSTLEITSASHPYRSTLSQGNKFEIFFEGIDLPSVGDDEYGSHGYVAFMIKPASGLNIGDVIENQAKIYFDYNFPILTNTVSTAVTQLATNHFSQGQFTMYPNPVKNSFTIDLRELASVRSIVIYNMIGQIVKAVQVSEDVIIVDVSDLNAGTYLVEVNSEKGKTTKKLIKL